MRNSNSAIIGIDLGGTNLRFALLDMSGTILIRDRQPTEIDRGKDALLHRLTAGIAGIRDKAAGIGLKVRAIGAGAPGLILKDGTILSSVNLAPLEGLNLRSYLELQSGLPVTVANDANAAAYGEKSFGAGKPFSSFLLLTIGTGVGSGLILDNKVWTGADGLAAEYGHATIVPDGRSCPCGNKGCLEQYASANAIVLSALEAVQLGRGGPLASYSTGEITAETVARHAFAGDPLSLEIFNEAGRFLGIAAASTVNLLNIEAILIGGGVARSFGLLAGPMLRELSARAYNAIAARVKIISGALGDDAGCIGSAVLAMNSITRLNRLRLYKKQGE
ncbi:MAG: ROK family protein [Deltaproteobacteria bacterium]